MMGSQDVITQEVDERRYYSQIPNLIDEMELTPHAVRLYLRIKRRAADYGACWENTGNLANGCHMSAGMVSKAKKELVKAGLIKIERVRCKNGRYDNITVNDIWPQNMVYFSRLSQYEHPISQCETKNIHFKKEPKVPKKRADAAAIPGGAQKTAHPRPYRSCEDIARDEEFKRLREHPAIKACKRVTGYFPGKSRDTYKHIIDTLGENPDIEKLERAFGLITGRGHNGTNWMHLMEKYLDDGYYSGPNDKWADETYKMEEKQP